MTLGLTLNHHAPGGLLKRLLRAVSLLKAIRNGVIRLRDPVTTERVVRILLRAIAIVAVVEVPRIIGPEEIAGEAVGQVDVVAPVVTRAVVTRAVEIATAIIGDRKIILVAVDAEDKSEAMNQSSLMMQS